MSVPTAREARIKAIKSFMSLPPFGTRAVVSSSSRREGFPPDTYKISQLERKVNRRFGFAEGSECVRVSSKWNPIPQGWKLKNLSLTLGEV